MSVFISIWYIQFKVFLKPGRQRGSMAVLAHPLSLWHVLSLLPPGRLSRAATQKQTKDNFGASDAFSCLGKLITDFFTFHVRLQQGLESQQLRAITTASGAGNQESRTCLTTTSEGAGQAQRWQPASAQGLGHQASVW